MTAPAPPSHQRALRLLAVVVSAVAIIVFLFDTSQPRPRAIGYHTQALEGQAQQAQSYSALRERRAGVDAELYTTAADLLRQRLPRVDEVVERRPGDRAAASSARAELRAYDGAPPMIPHPIDQRAQPNCLVCHEHGAKIRERVAPAMSHRVLQSCTQCHAPTNNPLLGAEPAQNVAGGGPSDDNGARGNVFEGLPMGGLGERAWAGAPPVMPHSMWMRERCSSCHGVSGRVGLRTTHPERQNCAQCHAPRALLDPTRAFAFTSEENR